MIDALEARRLLSDFTVNGTAGPDDIEIDFHVVGVNQPVYDITINGVHTTQGPGSPIGNTITINALDGDDRIQVRRLHFNDDFTVRPGPGNDALEVGSGSLSQDIDGDIHIEQQPNEGSDSLFIDDSNGSNFDIHVDSVAISAGNANIFHGGGLDFIRLTVVDATTTVREVFVDESIPNMTIDMGTGAGIGVNFVYFGGSNHVVESSEISMTLIGADLVRFDDRGAPEGRTFNVRPTSILGKTLINCGNLDFLPRDASSNFYIFNITGNPALTTSIQSCSGVVNVGGFISPIDLASLSGTFFSRVRGSTNLFHKDVTSSNSPFLFQSFFENEQNIRKGNFNLFVNDTDIDLLLRVDDNRDNVFNIAGLATGSNVDIFSGEGDDILRTVNSPADLDETFAGDSFSFSADLGNDTIDLSDVQSVLGNNADYVIGSNTISKGDFNTTPRTLLIYSGVEKLVLRANNDPNRIFFDFSSLNDVEIFGNGGADTFINRNTTAPTKDLFECMTTLAILHGGAGIDVMSLDDSDGPAGLCALESTFFTKSRGAIVRDIVFDGIDTFELFGGAQDDIVQIREKPAGATLNFGAGGGNDTVIVGGGDLDASGLFSNSVTLSGGAGIDHIAFDDHLDAEPGVYTFSGLTISKDGAVLIYSSFETQSLDVADGAAANATPNSVNIGAVSSFITSTTIRNSASARFDASVLAAVPSIANTGIGLRVELHGQGANDTLILNDTAPTSGASYTIGSSAMTRIIGASVKTIAYSGLDSLILHATNFQDNINVQSTAPGMGVTTNANGGNDTLSMGNGNIELNLKGPVFMHGGAGTDTGFYTNTFDNTPATQVLNGMALTDGGITHRFTGIEALRVNEGPGGTNLTINSTSVQTNVTGGAGNDTFIVGGGDIGSNLPSGVPNSLTIDAQGGTDSLFLNDLNDPNLNSYFINTTRLDLSDAGIHWFVNWFGVEAITLDASNGTSTSPGALSVILVEDTAVPLRVNGNGGNDWVIVNDASAPVFAHTGLGDKDFMDINQDFDTVPVTVIIDQDDDIENLDIRAHGTLRVTNGATVVKTRAATSPGSMSIDGVLDLADGAFLSRAGGPSLASFRTFLTRGHNNGAWNGTNAAGSINSSIAASSPFSDGVGYGLGSQIALTTIAGFSIGANDTLLRYTRDGDADLSGTVNLNDFNLVAANFGQSNKVWVDGDSNYDGLVNLNDFNALAGNFGRTAIALDVLSQQPIRGSEDGDGGRETLEELTSTFIDDMRLSLGLCCETLERRMPLRLSPAAPAYDVGLDLAFLDHAGDGGFELCGASNLPALQNPVSMIMSRGQFTDAISYHAPHHPPAPSQR